MTNDSRVVGQSVARVDARAKVTGKARYPGDLEMPGMLHMKILFAERPHTPIVRLDTWRAEKYPGVVAVFTAKDVPVNEYGLQEPDQPVLCGPNLAPALSPVQGEKGAAVEVVRFVGDQIALIVAETEKAATEARDLIEVEFQDLPIVTDPIVAMKPDAPRIHPEQRDSNVCVHYKIRKGDLNTGLAQSDVIVESEYHTPFQEHAYLQPEAGLEILTRKDA
jgi:CO/xanthine dehydrogenase Mo-binding subunit